MSAGRNERIAVTDETLHAYVDGELGAAGRVEVETWLAANPDRALEIAEWQRQNATLATLYAPVAAEPLPSRLEPRRIAARIGRERSGWTRLAVAAVVVLAVGLGGGWVLRAATWQGEPAAERLIDGALTAHSLYVKETRHAVEVSADDKGHLVTWLSNRLGQQIDAPDLATQGFTLVGGRLLPPLAETGTGPAAQLMYQNQSADRLTVYITAATKPVGRPFETYAEDGLEAYYWANAQITCTVVGDLPQKQMQTVARGVYQQLTWRPDPAARS